MGQGGRAVLLALLSSAALAAGARAEDTKAPAAPPKSVAQASMGLQRLPGLLPVYLDPKGDRVLLALSCDATGHCGEFLYQVYMRSGLGGVDKKDRSLLATSVLGARSAPVAYSDAQEMPKGLIALMAVACGLSVAGLYYAQPLAGPIGLSLGLHQAAVGLLVTLAQLGYVAGLIPVVPLGDLVENPRLIVLTLAATAAALALATHRRRKLALTNLS